MNSYKKMTAFQAVGSIATVMVFAAVAAGCSGGGSSGGGGVTTNSGVAPKALGQVSDTIVSSSTPKGVVVEFNVEMDANETLNASKIEIIQNQNNPTQIDDSKMLRTFPSTTTPGVTVPGASGSGQTIVRSVKITWDKPAEGGVYRYVFKINGNAGSAQFPEHAIAVQDDPEASGFALSATSGTGSLTTTASWSTQDSDSNASSVTAEMNWGDGSTETVTGNSNATHTYTSAGTFNIVLTLTDPDGNMGEATATVTVNSSGSTPSNPLTIAGAANTRIPLVGNETEADVLTVVSNEAILIRGTNFKHDMANRVLKATVDNVQYDVYVASDILLVFHAPRKTTPGTFPVTLAAYDKNNPTVLIEQAQVVGAGPSLKYAHATGSTVVHAGDDSTSNFDGTMQGFDLNAVGQANNLRQIYAGVGHKWAAASSFAAMNDGKTVWGLGFTGFQVQLFKVDATGGVAAVSTNISTSPATNQSPSLMTTTQNGRPVFLTQEPSGFYRLWMVNHDMTQVMTQVHFNVAGQQLPAGGANVCGLHTVVADGVEYALIVAGNTVRKLFQVRLDNGTYIMKDLGQFAPQASSMYLDFVNGVYRVEMAGQSSTGPGTAFSCATIGTGSDLDFTTPVSKGSSTNKVLGVQGYRDQNGALRVSVIRQSENTYNLHDPASTYGFVSNVELDSTDPTKNAAEMVRAPGMNAYVVGMEGAGGSGFHIVPFDGSPTKVITVAATNYVSIAVGRQVVDIKVSSPSVSSKYYHSFTDTTSALLPYNLGRSGSGPTKYGVSTP